MKLSQLTSILSLLVFLSSASMAFAKPETESVDEVKQMRLSSNSICKISRHSLALRQVMSEVAIEARQRIISQPAIDDIKNIKHYQGQPNIPPMITEFDLENLDKACSEERNRDYRADKFTGWYG